MLSLIKTSFFLLFFTKSINISWNLNMLSLFNSNSSLQNFVLINSIHTRALKQINGVSTYSRTKAEKKNLLKIYRKSEFSASSNKSMNNKKTNKQHQIQFLDL